MPLPSAAEASAYSHRAQLAWHFTAGLNSDGGWRKVIFGGTGTTLASPPVAAMVGSAELSMFLACSVQLTAEVGRNV